MAYSITGPLAEEVKRTPNLRLVPTYFTFTTWMLFTEQWDPKSPWHDKRVRLAANLAVALARMGRKVSFTCDGCPPDLQATIIYVSPRAEFTPPVIYSQSARAKLVFLIEARPDKMPDNIALAPGLPVSVAPFADGGS